MPLYLFDFLFLLVLLFLLELFLNSFLFFNLFNHFNLFELLGVLLSFLCLVRLRSRPLSRDLFRQASALVADMAASGGGQAARGAFASCLARLRRGGRGVERDEEHGGDVVEALEVLEGGERGQRMREGAREHLLLGDPVAAHEISRQRVLSDAVCVIGVESHHVVADLVRVDLVQLEAPVHVQGNPHREDLGPHPPPLRVQLLRTQLPRLPHSPRWAQAPSSQASRQLLLCQRFCQLPHIIVGS